MESTGSAFDHGEFCALVAVAAEEALTDRQLYILDLRLGLSNGEPQTLEQVGRQVDLTRERIRQIVEKCIRRIRSRAKAQASRQQLDGACLTLTGTLQSQFLCGREDQLERLVEFSLGLPYSHSHIVWHLLYPKSDVKLLRELEKQRKVALRAVTRPRPSQNAISRLIGATAWPGMTRKLSSMPYTCRQREVSPEGIGHSGSFKSEKMAREVAFESGLEAGFLRALDLCPLVDAYQEQPFSVSYKSGERFRLYFPDVFVLLKDGRALVVEIKPLFQFGLRANLIKWTALKAFCRVNGYGLLVTDGRIELQHAQRHSVPPEYRTAMQEALASGSISWPRYCDLRNVHHPSRLDFTALLLQDKLEWSLLPFRIRREARPS